MGSHVVAQASSFMDQPAERMAGLNLLNNTNLDYFQPPHQAEIFRLKGLFLDVMGNPMPPTPRSPPASRCGASSRKAGSAGANTATRCTSAPRTCAGWSTPWSATCRSALVPPRTPLTLALA